MQKRLHIIAFNVPYPADYGGVIDVFYKLKALSEQGVQIILHTFEYGREHAAELEKLCEKVYYYKRKTGFRSQFSFLPYVVYSRRDKNLLKNLQNDDCPILFEGLHTCYYLSHPSLQNHLKIVRLHNIEHRYYQGLAAGAHSFSKKIYFAWEALRLNRYEKQLRYAEWLFPLSYTEAVYFEQHYGKEKVQLTPLFFQNAKKNDRTRTIQLQVLYQGDLSTPENIQSARYLMRELASLDTTIPFVFAGKNPAQSLVKLAETIPNVQIIANPTEEVMLQLIQESAVCILYTEQISGVKLKLINALYQGNYCLANDKILAGSGLESLCIPLPEDPQVTIQRIQQCFQNSFSESDRLKRLQAMNRLYNNDVNARKIIERLPDTPTGC